MESRVWGGGPVQMVYSVQAQALFERVFHLLAFTNFVAQTDARVRAISTASREPAKI